MALLPLPYNDTFEVPEDDEARTGQALVDALLSMSRGHEALRAVHAKSHGLLTGCLQVLPLPEHLAQGVFARPAEFQALVRLSSSPNDINEDVAATPRGLALKLLGVPGDRGGTTQDFLLVNEPACAARSASEYLARLPTLGRCRRPLTHILGETFFSQVPFLYGPFMAKWCVAPVSPPLLALSEHAFAFEGNPDGQREAVVRHFQQHGAEWELRAQLCVDIERMPIEDASVPWPERLSPFVPVARLCVPPQLAWSESRSMAMDDGLSFNPWHCLAAHRPLGAINRLRRLAYEHAAATRSPRGRCPVMEPARPAATPPR